MAYRSSSNNSGLTSSNTFTVPVPTGAATDDIAIIAVNHDSNSITFTWPSGFTELNLTSISSPDGHSQAFAWKRLTGADSGNYTVTDTNDFGLDFAVECALFSGRDTTNPPVATAASNSSANSTPISVTATGVTAVTGDDLLWIGGLDVSTDHGNSGCAPPSTFTERQDLVNAGGNGTGNISMATKDNVSSGATGSITGVFTTTVTAGWFAGLVRIPAAAGAAGVFGKVYQAKQAVKRAAYW